MAFGLEKVINEVNEYLEGNLFEACNTSFNGIAYRNNRVRNDDIVAELFNDVTGDYKEVMFDDKFDSFSFFDIGNTISNVNFGNQANRDVRLIFAVNVENVLGTKKRDLEQVYSKVIEALSEFSILIELDTITTGLNAYGDLFTGNLLEYNQHPFHVFGIDMNIKINYSKC